MSDGHAKLSGTPPEEKAVSTTEQIREERRQQLEAFKASVERSERMLASPLTARDERVAASAGF